MPLRPVDWLKFAFLIYLDYVCLYFIECFYSYTFNFSFLEKKKPVDRVLVSLIFDCRSWDIPLNKKEQTNSHSLIWLLLRFECKISHK